MKQRATRLIALATVAIALACGARTGLDVPSPEPPVDGAVRHDVVTRDVSVVDVSPPIDAPPDVSDGSIQTQCTTPPLNLDCTTGPILLTPPQVDAGCDAASDITMVSSTLRVDDTFIYFTALRGTGWPTIMEIWRVAKTGGSMSRVATNILGPNCGPSCFALDGSYVYYWQSDGVHQAAKDGSSDVLYAVPPLATYGNGLVNIVGSQLYAWENGYQDIGSIYAVSSGTATFVASFDDPQQVTVLDGTIYAADDNGFESAPLDGGVVSTLISAYEGINVVNDGTSMYALLGHAVPDYVNIVQITPGVTNDAIGTIDLGWFATVDATSVYVWDDTNGGAINLYAFDKTTHASTTVVSIPYNMSDDGVLGDLAVDDRCIYYEWENAVGNQGIYGVAK